MTLHLELRIDELLLDTPWRADRDAISAGLSAHLARLSAAGDPPRRTRDSLHIEQLTIDAAPDADADEVARRLAEQIWRRLRGGRR
jgi:hypothetical protein